MRYVEYCPPPALAHLVKTFWVLEYASEEGRPMDYSLFADGLPNMVMQYQGQRFSVKQGDRFELTPLNHFSAAFDKPAHMKSDGSFGLIGACLYPRAIQKVFDLKPEEVTNCDIGLNTLFGHCADLLEEQIYHAESDSERIGLLAKFLLEKEGLPDRQLTVTDMVIRAILKKKGRSSIKEMAEYSGYSIRQLERSFRKTTGLSPKYFSRIVRFQNSMKSYELLDQPSLGYLAYESGYADQAHFIREFSEFSGMSPKVYFKELSEVASSFVQL